MNHKLRIKEKLKYRLYAKRYTLKASRGFTLIELLVVLVVLLVVGSILIGILVSSLRGTNKVNSIDNVRRNGNYALEQMGKMIRYSQSFNGVSTDGVTYTTSCVLPTAAVFSPPVISASPPRLGFFSRIANLIQGFGNLGKREVFSVFSKLAVLIPKFDGRGQAPQGQVAGVAIGPRSPSVAADDSSIGIVSWGSVTNIYTSDNNRAYTTGATRADTSHYLVATNFGFAIPADATIDGIIAEVEIQNSNSTSFTSYDNAVRIVKNGTIGSIDKSNGLALPSSDMYISYGSASDLWGTSWVPSDINSSNFGFAISVRRDASALTADIALIDHVRITVYYTIPAPTGTPTPTPTPGPTSTPGPTPTPSLYHYVKITGFDGGQTILSCVPKESPLEVPPEIASTSASGNKVYFIDTADQTTSTVNIDSCSITCTQGTVVSPPTVTIQFSLSNKTFSGLSENQASVPFQTSVTVRNY